MRTVPITIAIAAAALVGCSDSTGPEKFDPQSLVGVWEVVPDSSACWQGKPFVWFRVTSENAEGYRNGILNVFSKWSRNHEKVDEGYSITGHFNTDTKTALFKLHHPQGPFAEIRGDLNDGEIQGTITAPKGMVSAFHACGAPMKARKL